MRVLLLSGSRLFSCGTNAFSPVCTARSASDLAHVIETVNGVARCPYDPKHNSTAMLTESGDLYAATVIDFSGRDPVIYRSLGNMSPLRTAQYNSKWLNGKYNMQHITYRCYMSNILLMWLVLTTITECSYRHCDLLCFFF